ncbi:NUDIX domain-containing protein [Phreatobacter sp.]|uniref:NUDIX domain-containing protein n=1 Tax=Phreatobacter sp. TaxID=1966341 RepID=UPI003F6EC60D
MPMRLIRHLDLVLDPGPWAYAEREAAAIGAAWARWSAENPSLFDGEVLVLAEGGPDGETFAGRYRVARFSAFLHFLRAGKPDGSRNAFALAALTGSDGGLVMGVMGAETANAGRIYFPGGTPDRGDVFAGRVDLDHSVRRELAEETGLTGADVTFTPGFRLFSDKKRHALLKEVRSALPAAALAELIRERLARQDRPELAGVHVVMTHDDLRPAAMPDFQLAYARWWLETGRARVQPAG